MLKDSPIHTARDLIGKKVGMNTLGAHSEAMLDIYLQRHGLSQADIKKVEPLGVPPVNAPAPTHLNPAPPALPAPPLSPCPHLLRLPKPLKGMRT